MWIQTASGARIILGDSSPQPINPLVDIAGPLSKIVRYSGQQLTPDDVWTVGAHVLACEEFARRMGWPLVVRWLCLHHDDEEAVIGDIVAPVKAYIRAQGGGNALSQLSMCAQAIAVRAWGGRMPRTFGTVDATGETEADLIRRADLAVLHGERLVLMAKPPHPWATDDGRVSEQEELLAARCVISTRRRFGQGGALIRQEYVRRNFELIEQLPSGWTFS